MRKEILEQMSDAELVDYARTLGIKAGDVHKAKDKVSLIFNRWEREEEITVYGETFKVKAKTLKDKKFVDLVAAPNATDEQMAEALLILLGEEQVKKLYELCTDEDGTVDINAVGIAFAQIVSSPQLKN